MIVVRDHNNEPYTFPHILDMRRDLEFIRNNWGDSKIGSLVNPLKLMANSDKAKELERIEHLIKVLNVRIKAASRNIYSAPSEPSFPQAVDDFQRRNGNNPEFGDLGLSSFARQAYDVSMVKYSSDTKVWKKGRFLVSRQEYWLRELNEAKKWLLTRQSYIKTRL